MVKEMMDKVGIEASIIQLNDGNPIVYGELKAKKVAKTLMFYNHYDVMPPEPIEEWIYDPFSATVKEGKIYARGVADNKGNLVARLKAVEAILKTFNRVPINLKFVFEGEEEIGSPHLPVFIKKNRNMLRADGCVWEGGDKDPKGRPIIRLGLKGHLSVELRVRGAGKDLHSRWAPIVPNPAWRLVWALNTMKNSNEEITIEGFYNDVKKPTKQELKLIEQVPFEEEEYKRIFGLNRFISGSAGSETIKRLISYPACTICGFDSGYKGPGLKSIVPSKAVAKVGFRLVADQEPEDIFSKLKVHLEKYKFNDIELVKIGQTEPAKTPIDAHIAKTVIDTAKEIYGLEPIVYPNSPGSGPMYLFTNWLRIPTVSTGCKYAESSPHAPNENIRVADYIKGIKHIASIIMSF